MNKKIKIIGGLIAFLLITIVFASTVSSYSEKAVENKESPLYQIRTQQRIIQKIDYLIKNIKTKFLGERMFFLPAKWIKIKNISRQSELATLPIGICSSKTCITCIPPCP